MTAGARKNNLLREATGIDRSNYIHVSLRVDLHRGVFVLLRLGLHLGSLFGNELSAVVERNFRRFGVLRNLYSVIAGLQLCAVA